METNASNVGMGVVLWQNGHPIAYVSKAFSPKSQKLSVYEIELLAITGKWRHTLSEDPLHQN